MAKKKAPSLYVISGTEDFLAQRKLREMAEEARINGFSVVSTQGGDLPTAMQGDPFCDRVRTFLVVREGEKADVGILEEHVKNGNPEELVLVLFVAGSLDGRTKFGKFMAGLAPAMKADFSPPEKPWEAEEAAHRFCAAEATRMGKTLTLPLAKALAERVGVDYGTLSFEVEKVCLLADADGVQEITAQMLGKTIALVAEAEVQPAIRALGAKSKDRFLRAMQRIRDTSDRSGSPVMKVTAALEYWAYRALAVADLRERGLSADDAAVRLNLNPWFYKNKLLPEVARWGVADVIKLIRALGESQRAVLNGHLDPWTGMLARLLGVFPCGTAAKGRRCFTVRNAGLRTTPPRHPFDQPVILAEPYVFDGEAAQQAWEICGVFEKDSTNNYVSVGDSGRGIREGKWAEFAAAQWLKETFGLDCQPDVRTPKNTPGYMRSFGSDLETEGVSFSVKTSITHEGAFSLQANESGGRVDALLAGIGVDPQNIPVSTDSPQILGYPAYVGNTSFWEVFIFCHVDKKQNHVKVFGSVPWPRLVEWGLLQKPLFRSRDGEKLGIYWHNILWHMGYRETFLFPDGAGGCNELARERP